MFYLYEIKTIEGLLIHFHIKPTPPFGTVVHLVVNKTPICTRTKPLLNSICRPNTVLDRLGITVGLEDVHVAGVCRPLRPAGINNFCLLRDYYPHHLGEGSDSGPFG